MLLQLTRKWSLSWAGGSSRRRFVSSLRWRVVRRPECLLVRPFRCGAGESDVESEGFDLADVVGDLPADGDLPFVVRA